MFEICIGIWDFGHITRMIFSFKINLSTCNGKWHRKKCLKINDYYRRKHLTDVKLFKRLAPKWQWLSSGCIRVWDIFIISVKYVWWLHFHFHWLHYEIFPQVCFMLPFYFWLVDWGNVARWKIKDVKFLTVPPLQELWVGVGKLSKFLCSSTWWHIIFFLFVTFDPSLYVVFRVFFYFS